MHIMFDSTNLSVRLLSATYAALYAGARIIRIGWQRFKLHQCIEFTHTRMLAFDNFNLLEMNAIDIVVASICIIVVAIVVAITCNTIWVL